MKKILSLVLSFCVMLNLFCVSIEAKEPELVVEFCEGEYIDYSDLQSEFSYNAPSYFYDFTIGKQIYNCYSLLNDLEKTFYDAVVNSDIGVLTFTMTYSPLLSAEEYNSIDFVKIMNAICLDHPEIFYYNGYSYSRSYYPSTGAVASISYSIRPKKHGQTNADIYTTANIPGYAEALENAFKSVEVDVSNRYNFVKSIHDYLCTSVTYINDYGSCHDVYGALVNKEAVCQGYAEAMKMFCDYYKVPSVLISGTANGGAHMWNAVQMDDGKWYLLDITWDDQTDTYWTFYDFFLVGLNTKDIYFGGSAFNASHVSDGSPYLPALAFASDKYTQVNHNTAFMATYNSRAIDEGNYLIRSCFDAQDTYVYYNGMYVDTENLATNGVFKVPDNNGVLSEKWTMVLLGDCNSDGTCDALDYSDAVNKLLADNGIAGASDMAADMDCDGSLDVIDLSVLQLASSGLDTDIKIE